MLVLDTHVLVWWAGGTGQLSRAAQKAIETEREAGGALIVSAISAWEIVMLVSRNRLALSLDAELWLSRVAEVEGVRFQAVDALIAMKSASLPGAFHKDPADRMIIATARALGAALVTADEKILQCPHVRTIA